MNYKNAKNIDDLVKYAKITDEMVNFYNKRTTKHIDLVRKYCKRVNKLFGDEFDGIIGRGLKHDESKWDDPEFKPYIYITWDYRCKDLGKDPGISEEIRDKMNEASEHHVHNNKHHPECHCKEKSTINKEDRDDIPDKKVDATGMEDLDIVEMVCDWCAMSEEKGEDGPKGWADKNINKRWKFTDKQKDLIYKLIDTIWE